MTIRSQSGRGINGTQGSLDEVGRREGKVRNQPATRCCPDRREGYLELSSRLELHFPKDCAFGLKG